MTDDSAPDIDAMRAMAEATVAGFPTPFQAAAAHVIVQVVDWPDPDMLSDLQIYDPLDLTGLYDGIPMTHKSVAEPAPFPDMVWLFREPILAEWRDRGDVTISELVAHVTVHEFAHHFGWSDEDIAQIDKWWL